MRCLFCTTGKEEAVARGIEASGHGRALFPQRDKRFLVGRAWVERPVALLPGYVFVYSDEERAVYRARSARRSTSSACWHTAAAMTASPGATASSPTGCGGLQGRVGVLKALEVGDPHRDRRRRVQAAAGGASRRWTGAAGAVRVELDTSGAIRQLWLAYEIVDRVDADALRRGMRRDEERGTALEAGAAD